MIISASSVMAGAVSVSDCGNLKIVNTANICDISECCDVHSLIGNICADGQCDANSVIAMLRNVQSCPGGNCDTSAPKTDIGLPTNTTPPSEPTKPAESEKTTVETPIPSADEGFNSAYEDEVIRLVNVQRTNYGLAPLTKDEGAAAAAHIRAKEIVISFSHTRPDGSSCFTAASELGVSYKAAGENIAYGYASPEQVVNGWMNSEGHRKNILSSSFSKIGVGCYSNGGTLYWSQFFIG